MSMQSIDLASGGSASFPFNNHGDSVTGRVISLEELQQTDLQTGEPKTFDNGQPMMMYRVELQTELRDSDLDDGVRSVYLRGSRKPESQSSLAAVLQAVLQATGRAALTVGGTLTLTYVGDGQAKNRGFSAPKLYRASYQPPTVNLDAQQAAPAAAVAAPAAAPAASPWATPAPAPAAQQPAALNAAQLAALQAAGIDPAALGGGAA
ncbi:hypothetical protein [Arachnia propionica]|uniref:hypothetical protein n=1 Tax=Arachnia propionica TaxID=1750 RepID=UPI001639525E|nr:hypothetical protein [Arachnia propionica]